LLFLIYFLGIKRQRREFELSPTYTAEVLRIGGAVLLASPPPMPSWYGSAIPCTFMLLRTKFFTNKTSLYAIIVRIYFTNCRRATNVDIYNGEYIKPAVSWK
jgi:hypothetical protein